MSVFYLSKTFRMFSVYCFTVCVRVCVCACAQSCLTLATHWTVARQARLSIEFSRQEYWSGLPFPTAIISLICPKFIFLHLHLEISLLITQYREHKKSLGEVYLHH